MKYINKLRIIKIVLLIAFLFVVGCKDNQQISNIKSAAKILEVNDAATKDLSSKTPLTHQQFEAIFPLKIQNMERDFIMVSTEVSNVHGTFGEGKIDLKITDAAGAFGPGLITMFEAIYNASESSISTVVLTKKVRNNIKTIGTHHPDYNDGSMEFIYRNRFHVIINAKNMTPDDIWNLFDVDKYLSDLNQF